MAAAPLFGLSLGGPPEDLPHQAAAAEEAGFDEVWLGEDFFDSGGIAAAALALAATDRLAVGLGVLSAAVRHPALLAMELAALGRVYPGRLIAGIGLGDPEPLGWLNALPPSPLALVRQAVASVRTLLSGGQAQGSGGGQFALAYPAALPVHVGAMGPRMLRLAGEVGDGTVLSVGAAPAYVEWARRRIAEARDGDLRGHRVTALAFVSVAADTEKAREAIRSPLARLVAKPVFRPMIRYSGLGHDAEQAAAGGMEALDRALGRSWVDRFAAVGDPPACTEAIGGLHRAGADCVVLCPWGDVAESTRLLTSDVLPALRGPAEA
jgi:5,10-methylenetetrahydromethanopterin reductase